KRRPWPARRSRGRGLSPSVALLVVQVVFVIWQVDRGVCFTRPADGLVSYCDEHKYGSADHQQEHAQVEERGGNQVQLAQKRDVDGGVSGGEERFAKEPRAHTRGGGQHEAQTDPADG